jgi:hypothetical protein
MDGGASIVEIQHLQKLVGDYLGIIQKFVMDMEDVCVMMFVDVDLDGMVICVSMKDLHTNVVDDTIGIQLFVVDTENVLFLFQKEEEEEGIHLMCVVDTEFV